MKSTIRHLAPSFAPVRGLTSSSSAGTTVTVINVGSTDILIGYDTLPGNDPSTNSNTVFLWQNQTQIPYNLMPLNHQAVGGLSQSGSMDFTGLQVQEKSYIIGYAVGPAVSNICSWVAIPASGTDMQTFQTSIICNPSNDVVVVDWTTPAGNQPLTNHHSIAIWKGAGVPWGVTPLATATLNSNNAEDSQALPVTLLRSTTYTVAYVAGPNLTALAATFTFTT